MKTLIKNFVITASLALLLVGCGKDRPLAISQEPQNTPPAIPAPNTPSIPQIPNPSIPEVPQVVTPAAGFFRNAEHGYYQNQEGHYCRIVSHQQWVAAGGPEDLSLAPVQALANLVDDGDCKLVGFISTPAAGYYANAEGHYCKFPNFPAWKTAGGPEDMSLAAVVDEIPANLISDGECQTRGFFSVGTEGYFASAEGHYCRFTSFSSWVASGGPEDVTQASQLQTIPENLVSDGDCAPRGFFTVGTEGYFANDQGHYCHFANYSSWVADGGPADLINVAQSALIPDYMVFDGECAHQE